jgi:hypothetical protein
MKKELSPRFAESERFNNAVRKMLGVSKEDLRKEEATSKRKQTKNGSNKAH